MEEVGGLGEKGKKGIGGGEDVMMEIDARGIASVVQPLE